LEECSENNAVYYKDISKNDSLYECTTYNENSGKIFSKQHYKNTVGKKAGFSINYYDNGNISDSICYNDFAKTSERYRFYEDGKLHFHVHHDSANVIKVEGYNEDGSIIPDFVYNRSAEFPGGKEEWRNYLATNCKTKFSKELRGRGLVNVIVQFSVEKDGSIGNVTIVKSSGIDEVDKNAIEVITNSPKWLNGVVQGQPVNTSQKQPLTYNL
jgi:TonB family protein